MDNNNNIHVAVLIDVYNEYGGASKVAVDYGVKLKEYGYDAYIVANNRLKGQRTPDIIYIISSISKAKDFIKENNINVIHYFKSQKKMENSSIFYKMITAAEKKTVSLKVLMTVCQQPSNRRTLVSPFEIKNTDYFIFIDKTAYNDPLYNFIPESKKTWMYLSSTKEMLRNSNIELYVKKNQIDAKTVVYGRGSTLNKCPKDVIEIYDNIKIERKKKFIVIGIPEGSNWFRNKIKIRTNKDIEVYPVLSLNEYAKKVSTFDIMLYYLPANAHSSIDGSLTMALRLGIPAVVYGASAPKENIVHGVNGFIANTKEDFVRYAEMLGNNVSLREEMGDNARKLFFEKAPDVHWTVLHSDIMNRIYLDSERPRISLNFKTAAQLYIIKYSSYIYYFVERLSIMFRRSIC